MKAQKNPMLPNKETSPEWLLFQIENQRREIEKLKQDKADLEILLETVNNHADNVQAELYRANEKLEAEVAEKRRAEAKLESVLAMVSQEKADLEILLETIAEHNDALTELLEEKLKDTVEQSEIRLAQFLEAIPVGVFVVDCSGKPYYANRTAKRILGKDIVWDKELEELREVYQAYLAGSEEIYPRDRDALILALQGQSAILDDIEIRHQERIIPLEVRGTPIYDESGKIIYAIAVFQDITARKQAEKAIKQAEHKYRSIFENALEGIFQTTPEGRYLNVNPALAQLYGYDSPEDLMLAITDISQQVYVDSQRRSQFIEIMRKQGEISGFESQVYRQDGSIIWISENARSVYNEHSELLYYQGFVVDITASKQAEVERIEFTEQLLQLNKANERFVPSQFLQLLNKQSIVDIQVGDQVEKKMSILFADIRGFTRLSEGMTPEDNFKFINAYLSRMEPAIMENRGFIDKYIGDGLMALFNGSADDAVKAAITMMHRLAQYNTTRDRPERPPLKIGIGINTGLLMLGTVGGESRLDSTVIGDAVNLASRLEHLTKEYGVSVLVSHHTFASLTKPEKYNLRFVDRVQVSGKSKTVAVFEVFDADPPAVKECKLITKTVFEQAIWLFFQGKLAEARQQFANCLEVNPNDTVAKNYLRRCEQFLL
ncbi:PAS domain S-box protein [Oscillatoria salina]|uniref:PAS domain S-box protein n=1 Tax=Oscillatoria salina TaxID=331517 RepID=UPI0013B84A49|nr:PAS domain S-box protein [Oscillatoria salina]MBZ8181542.1 PAS domain S-box protein [Oscillatoria salina IIICB1]NET89278.1 PAS domain S-box protein [Kamptonema sp. SIO1D9]